jgi:hypothetical protein
MLSPQPVGIQPLADQPCIGRVIGADLQRPHLGRGDDAFRIGRIVGVEIDRDALAQPPAHQLADRHAQRLARQVPQRHLDAAHRGIIGAAGAADEQGRRRTGEIAAPPAPHVVHDRLDRQRIAARQQRVEIVVDDVLGTDRVEELAGAGQPFLGIDANEPAVEPVLQPDRADLPDLQLGRARRRPAFAASRKAP